MTLERIARILVPVLAKTVDGKPFMTRRQLLNNLQKLKEEGDRKRVR
jgi:hypothetical protein